MFTRLIPFIPYIIAAVGLIGLSVILYRKIFALVNLSKEEMDILDRKRGVIQRVREVDYKQHWLNVIILLEKFLRRIKILFLKIENLLGKWIQRLRSKSQLMTQKSREWIKQKEMKRRENKQESSLNKQSEGKEEVSIRVNNNKSDVQAEPIMYEEDDDLSISELKKPIREEQKWIDLIVENPKNITAYKFLGLLYWKQHNYSDARSSLEMAVKLGSKDRKVKETLEQLVKLKID